MHLAFLLTYNNFLQKEYHLQFCEKQESSLWIPLLYIARYLSLLKLLFGLVEIYVKCHVKNSQPINV